MLSYLIVVAFLPAIFAHHHIVPCPGGLPAPTGLRVANCNSFPCNINRGDTISYEVDFAATHSTDTLRLAMSATVLGVERPVTLPPGAENACNSLIRGACPVTQGESLTQGTVVPALTEYHGGIPAQIRFTISDIMHGHEHICVCALVNVVIH